MRHNDSMRSTQEIEENIQLQEESWREGKRIRKSQEEAEERKKQAEMDACTNKEQQVPGDQQSAKPQWNMRRNKNVPIRRNNI